METESKFIQISTCASGKLYALTYGGDVYYYDRDHAHWVLLPAQRSA